MKNKNALQKLVLLVVTSGFLSACSDSGFSTGSTISSESGATNNSPSAAGGGSGGGMDPVISAKSEPLVAVQNYEQIYVTMLNLTGLPRVSTLTVNDETNGTAARRIATEYLSRTSSFPVGPSASGINPPLLLGATSLASAVCDGLIEQERVITDMNSRVFFKNVNFTQAVSNFAGATYDGVIQNFAQEFWGRALDAEELKAFQDARTEFVANITAGQQTNATQTRGLALLTCTAALSSFESISL